MKIETLKERIDNAKAKIEKKQNTIEKKMALIAKKEEKIKKLGFEPTDDRCEVSKKCNDAYWLICDIDYLKDDIERGQREIKETKASLEKYELQLTGELEKESVLLKEIPESIKQMQVELVEHWDRWDKSRRERIKKAHNELEYKEFMKIYTYTDYEFMYKTDEQIHNANLQDAKMLILDLYYRVKKITGEITNWHGIKATSGAHGMTVLNGYIEGKEGRALAESILAGGYNIQRLHVRVLVKEFK